MAMQSINPATEEVLATFPEFSPQQVDEALEQANAAFWKWRCTSFAERGDLFRKAADYMRTHKAELSRLITLEMGKPIKASEAEIEKCVWGCEYFAENAERLLADRHAQTNAQDSYVSFNPLGVVLAVMPWNFPFWQVFRFAAPSLMAGNAAVVKHASNVPQCALAIEDVFREAGFPTGLVRTLLIPASTVDRVIADPRIAAVTLTGSDAAGSKVAEAAGKVIKKTVLELGGSDPFIVLQDADIQAAARAGATARFQNTGQSCIAAKRFIIAERVADEFGQRFKEQVQGLKIGDPLDPSVDVGPLARPDLRETLERQVSESVSMGARVEAGGRALDRPGYFYEPTILSNVTLDMPVMREEVFGPVASVIRVKNVEDAVALANATKYGLGASVWTCETSVGREMARQIQAGSVFINAIVASDPRLPFGGIKRSGYGRELAEYGIHEFVNIQTVWVGTCELPEESVARIE